MIRTGLALAVLLATGCGGAAEAPAVANAPVDLSVDARKAAVIEAVTQQFQRAIKETLLDRGLTVRGLARAATHQSKPAAALHASRYNPEANASAKIEIIEGKIIYTAVASATDQSAAVIADEHARWRISYEVEAAITPEGELKDFEFRELGVATRAN